MAEQTGAMVALVPTETDAARLVVDGGEPPAELHLTLFYLGEAADYDEQAQAAIVDRLRSLVEDVLRPDYDLPIMADVYAVDVFNPGADGSCVVLGVTGGDLEAVWDLAADALDEIEAEPSGFTLPEQHQPWVPHITVVYTVDPTAVVQELLARTGPVTFDRLRIAFAGDTVDILLSPTAVAKRYNPRQFRLPGGPHGGEWARPGNTAGSFAGSMPKLGEYDELSLPEAPKISAEVHRAFDSTHGGLTATINDQASKLYRDDLGRAVVRAEGVITNADDKIVGSFRRNLYPETGEVHNDTLALASTEQGAGFAQRYAERAEGVLADQGFTHATVSATGVGGYAWAKRYGWDPSKPTAAGDVPHRLASIGDRYPLTPEDAAKVQGWLEAFRQPDQAKWPTPKQIAEFGKDRYFRLSGDRLVWPGKDVMIDSAWSGARNLRRQPKQRRTLAKGGRLKYDEHQRRDPDGTWGDGIPGPSTDFDMSRLTGVVEVEGTFGDLAMGLHDTGDVRFTFRSDGQIRELDLGIDEVTELGDTVERLARERDGIPDDVGSLEVYDDDRFGYDNGHTVSLYGNGVIGVDFGADEPDPWTLNLDPPYETDDEDVDDAQLLLAAIDRISSASAALDNEQAVA